MYDTVLVGVDGSDASNRAVEYAMDLADRYDADIHAIYVVDTRLYGEPGLSSAELVIDELEDEGHAMLDRFADRADNRDIVVEKRVCHGVPHDEILAYADEAGVDLVVLGYQGQTHAVEDHIGSVVERVVRAGGRPVLVV
jgi:nucleotide-binding universal stress UspA family protein